MPESFVRPPRLTLVSLDDNGIYENTRLDAMFNPEELTMGIKAVYKDHAIPGMSHQLKQFSHTDNISLKFSIAFQVQNSQQTSGSFRTPAFTIQDREYAERFLMSLCVPRGSTDIGRNAPPTTLVLWPNFLSFEAVMLDVNLKYTRFNRNLAPIAFTAELTMDQLRDTRYTNMGMREFGHGLVEGGEAVAQRRLWDTYGVSPHTLRRR